MRLEEVGDTDGVCATTLLNSLKIRPFLLQLFVGVGEEGGVDEVLVYIMHSKLLQGSGEAFLSIGWFRSEKLRRDVEFFAWDARLLYGGADFGFVVVDLCAVDVSVSGLDRHDDGLD